MNCWLETWRESQARFVTASEVLDTATMVAADAVCWDITEAVKTLCAGLGFLGKRITKSEWARLSADRKTRIKGVPHILKLDRETGGTVLVPVEIANA